MLPALAQENPRKRKMADVGRWKKKGLTWRLYYVANTAERKQGGLAFHPDGSVFNR